ncbi:MAG TPA: hypothetical protein VLM38_15670 [Blastocatellia bacterium]|nr:hypothetical protein [Blastocatellia bacterium]
MPHPRLSILTIAILMFGAAFGAKAQDRPALLKKIESLRGQLQAKENVFLLPSEEDFVAYRGLLDQPDTGLVRLMPREKYDGKMLLRGGGAYYSFVRLTNAYGFGSDIGLERETLRTGFAGADFGFLTVIGDVPVDGITLDQPGVRYLAALNTPATEPEAREQQRRSSIGFEVDGFFYRGFLPAAVNTTYALRSTNYTESDVLLVFRVTRQDADGSLILAWKMLKRFLGPTLSGRFTGITEPPPRPVLEDQIHQLLGELKETEQQFLEPADKDRAKYADFLEQPDTGLIRLLPRETFQNKLTINEGAAFYSFVRLTHEYGFGSDLDLEQGQFGVGFAGADFGFLTRLGKVPIEEITLDDPAAQFLATFAPPTALAEARAQQRRTASGFEINGFAYKSRSPVKKKRAYLLRSIIYDHSDVLVAFRIASQDFDGSVVIVWKILKRFPAPQLTASQTQHN